MDHDRPASKGPTIRDDVLSHAREGSADGCPDPASAAVPTSPLDPELAVRPCGISAYRNADAAIDGTEQTVRSSPVGHRKIFSHTPLGAGPRLVLLPWRLPLHDADAPALGNGNSVGDGTLDHLPSSARPGPHANGATAWPPPGTPHCNNGTEHSGAERTARTPSAGNDDASDHGTSLVLKSIVGHAQEDPRELPLPKVRLGEESISSPGHLMPIALSLGAPPQD
jgi:hypothetical protein